MIAMSPMIHAASKMLTNFVYESFCTPAQIRLIKCNVYCIGKKLEMDCKMERTAINAAAISSILQILKRYAGKLL